MPVAMKFEKRHQKPAPRQVFYRRLGANLMLALAMIAASLLAGMAGYIYFENLAPIDAFLNAAMILSGMGPVATMQTNGGKLFAGFYAIYSGVVIIATTAVILAPVIHRVLHHFHYADDGGGEA